MNKKPYLLNSFDDIKNIKNIKNIGVIGGSYDPIHKAHIQITKKIQILYQLDLVILIPAYQNPLKVKEPIDGAHRIEMVRIVLEEMNDDKFCVCPIELMMGGKSFTVNTMSILRNIVSPNVNIYFITGTDILKSLHRWKGINKLLKLVHLVMIKRSENFRIEDIRNAPISQMISEEEIKDLESHCIVSEYVINISSTEIRNALIENNHKSIHLQMVEPCVLKYIRKNNLYFKRTKM